MSEEYNGNITEQLVEKEVREIIKDIKDDGIDYVEDVRKETVGYINDNLDSVVVTGDTIKGDIHFEDGDDVDEVISNTYKKGTLGDNYIDVKNLYEESLQIVADIDNGIENKVRYLIVENGYCIKYYNDGYGDATITVEEV